jgi:hypothetical protein
LQLIGAARCPLTRWAADDDFVVAGAPEVSSHVEAVDDFPAPRGLLVELDEGADFEPEGAEWVAEEVVLGAVEAVVC